MVIILYQLNNVKKLTNCKIISFLLLDAQMQMEAAKKEQEFLEGVIQDAKKNKIYALLTN